MAVPVLARGLAYLCDSGRRVVAAIAVNVALCAGLFSWFEGEGYFPSLYWAVTTASTAGYGDLSPRRPRAGVGGGVPPAHPPHPAGGTLVTTAPRRLRSTSVTIGVTALVAAGLTGCAPQAAAHQEQAICVDPATELRVDDDYCDDGATHAGGGYAWYHVSHGTRVPAVGSRYTTASGTLGDSSRSGTTLRSGTSAGSGGASSATGSDVTRGGFGSSGHVGS